MKRSEVFGPRQNSWRDFYPECRHPRPPFPMHPANCRAHCCK